MKTSLVRMYTNDNLELVGMLYEPDLKASEQARRVVVHVHGMAGNFYENSFLDYFAQTLTTHGVAFLTFNNRGNEFIKDLYVQKDGKRFTRRIGNTYERFEESVLDIQAALAYVRARGYKTTHLSGHSLGASKVAYFAHITAQANLASLIFLAPADMQGMAKADAQYERDIAAAREMIAQGKGDEIMPFIVWGDSYLSASTYMSISGPESHVAFPFHLHAPEELKTISGITLPMLAIMGSADFAASIPVPEALDIFKKACVASPRAEAVLLGEANHGYVGYEQKCADEVVRWVNTH